MNQQQLRRYRWASQFLCFSLFVFLLLMTEFRGSLKDSQAEIRLPYPVSLFQETDPLAALSTALSTHALYRGLLWSLVILIPTLFLGRFYCGWICPLGTLNHVCSEMRTDKKLGPNRLESNRYREWQTAKYTLLIAVLVAAFFGSLVAGILDPISLLVRSLGLSLLPALNYALNASFDALYRTGFQSLRFIADAVHFLLQGSLLSFKPPTFHQGFLLGLLFLGILLLNLRVTRFWCRALCPLGALLGLASRWSILGLEKNSENCDNCRRCALHCQGGDDPVPDLPWRKAECHLCFNCVAECASSGVRFRFFPSRAETLEAPQWQRRRVIAGLVAGTALLPGLRSAAGWGVRRDPRLIRPPGSLDEEHFLARCIRCGQCMKVCPNNALHPSLLEAGLEGLWTPVLVPRIGYCEPSCVLCGQVCPSGAIWEITQAEKTGQLPGIGKQPPIRVGTAFFDQGRCLPWAMARECIVCEEWCPTSPKAIYLKPAEVGEGNGRIRRVRQPFVDPEKCIGCGACEYACPVRDRPAVYVTGVGESRSRANQFLLKQS